MQIGVAFETGRRRRWRWPSFSYTHSVAYIFTVLLVFRRKVEGVYSTYGLKRMKEKSNVSNRCCLNGSTDSFTVFVHILCERNDFFSLIELI